MVPSAMDVDTSSVLDEIKAPAGVVLPPKEIKGTLSAETLGRIMLIPMTAILEKTAGYVARNGIVFEGRFYQTQETRSSVLTL
jgi:splicing factor 3A subunit 1